MASSETEYLLAALRCARLRVLLLANEIDEIGIALKFAVIGPVDAVEWLRCIDADRFVVGPAKEAAPATPPIGEASS